MRPVSRPSFDKWTQMDYYKMAAFTYGLITAAAIDTALAFTGP